MKRIEVTTAPAKLEEVKDVLAEAGVEAMSVREAKVYDRTSRRCEVYRGSSYVVDFTLEVEVVLVVREDQLRRILHVLEQCLAVGPGHGSSVLVSDVVGAIRFRPAARRDETGDHRA